MDVSDTVTITDYLSVSLAFEKSLSDLVAIADALSVKATLGAYASDAIDVVDQVSVQLIQGETEEIGSSDLLHVEARYERNVSDLIDIEDQLLVGEPELVAHGVEDGVNIGPAGVWTVTPTGPLSISGTLGYCVTNPVGFVVILGDAIECTDQVLIVLESIPSNALVLDGIPLLLDGQYLTI